MSVSAVEDSPDSTPPPRPLRSMQTGQNSIAPENSLPQLGQVRWGSALMGLTVLRMRLTLRKKHGFPRQPAAARLGNQVPGSESLAMPKSTERCQTVRRSLLPSCGPVSIVTSYWSTTESITCNQSLESAFDSGGTGSTVLESRVATGTIRLPFSVLRTLLNFDYEKLKP